MLSLKLIYDEIYHSNNPRRDPQFIIKTFEENYDAINSVDVNSNRENYDLVLFIISDYAHCLVGRECYTKAIPFLNRAISLWEHNPA